MSAPPLSNRASVAAVNHLLASAAWARDTLRPHAGRHVRLEIPPLRWDWLVTPVGLLDEAAADAQPDLALSMSPLVAVRLGTGDAGARAEVVAKGDDVLARAVWHVASQLRWDAEEDLSRLFGDVAAHRLAEAVRGGLTAGRESVRRLEAAVGEYVSEEGRFTPPRLELEAFARDVDDTRERVDRLEARLDRLERAVRSRA